MDASLTAALISGIGVILTAWLGFMGTRKGTLATAEKDFREVVMEDNKNLRTRVEELEKKLSEMTIDYNKLQIVLLKIQGEHQALCSGCELQIVHGIDGLDNGANDHHEV